MMNSTSAICAVNVDVSRISENNGATPLLLTATSSADHQQEASTLLHVSTLGNVRQQKLAGNGNNPGSTNRTSCMFETGGGNNNQNGHHVRFAAAYGPPVEHHLTFTAWSQQQNLGSNNSTSSTSSGGAVNNTIERTSDANSGSSSSNTPLCWSYPAAMIFVPESYYPYNNNNNNNNNNTSSNNLLVPGNNGGATKYWSETYQMQEQQPISSKTASSSAATTTTISVADLQYDHEPTYANLTPIRRAAANSEANNNIETQPIPTTRTDYRYNTGFDNITNNGTSMFNNSSYQCAGNQLGTVANRPTPYVNHIYANNNGYNVRKTVDTDGQLVPHQQQTTATNYHNTSGVSGTGFGGNTSTDGNNMNWYGNQTLLTLSNLASARNSIPTNSRLVSATMGTTKPLSPMGTNNLHQNILNNASTWSLSSGSNKSPVEHGYLQPAQTITSTTSNKTQFQQSSIQQQSYQQRQSKLQHHLRPTGMSTSTTQNNNASSTPSANSNGNKKLFICYICSKAYARPSTLRMHMRIHSGVRPYHCRICNKSFCQTANLSAHLRTHNGDKPFACPMCQRKFSQSSSVKTHMRVHTGQRPYKCQACSKTFSDSSTLAKHRRTHNGDRPYMCSVCYLRFTQSGNLNRHMRIHRSMPASSNGSTSQKETATA